MSVDQIQSRKPPRRSDDVKVVRYDDYIDGKIQSTRRAVKLVDLTSSLVALSAGVLAYLFVLAVIEHWLVPNGFSVAVRTALFVALVICTGYYAYRRLWPLLIRAINPVFAAHAIEEGSPALKNSLINLLLFRERRSDIPDAVYRTLEEQAAQRLTRVPTDTAIDRSPLIRLGYVLVGVAAIAGLYKIFSPKDPLISAKRVLMPWADIVPASRVTIVEVAPGSLTVSRGELVDVSAEVHGLGADDAAVLRYTTDDGQVVEKPIPMKPAGDGLRFSCRLTDEADSSQHVGLTRDLRYRLEAGDARSLDYSVHVVAAPSILVERVDYAYPAYTGFIDRSVDGLGDIRAIEGTHITIHARANGPIRVADVDFDADGQPDLRMTPTGSNAIAKFELSLREDRQTPRHPSYVLRFTNEDGRTNHDPVKHSIIVERDKDPEAAILQPKDKSIDVRLDETVGIEVEARDPDFALSAVHLHGEVAGRPIMDETLLKSEHRGRFTNRYSFTPKTHDLHAGDTVEYWVEAADNRTPKPNTVSTEHKSMRIVSPDPAKQPPPNQVAQNDRQQPKQGDQQDQQQDGRQQKQDNQKGQGGKAGEKGNADQKQGGENGEQQQQSGDNKQKQNSDKQQGGGAGGKGGDSKEQKQSDGNSKSGSDSSDKNAQGSKESGQEGQSGGQPQANQQAKSNQDKSDGQKSNGEQTGAGASGGQSSKDTARPDGARPDQDKGSQQANGSQQKGSQQKGEQQKGDQQAKPGNEQSPVSSQGDNDGEAFERIQRHMEQNGQLKKGEQSGADKDKSAEQQKADQTQNDKSGQGDKETGRQGEGEKTEQQKAKDRSDGASKPKDGESAGREATSADGKSDETNTKPPAGQKPSDRGEEAGKKAATDGTDQQKKQDNANQQQQTGQKPEDSTKGSAAKNGGDDAQRKQQKDQAGDAQKQDKSQGGQQTATKGPAGAGNEQKPQGSPESQPDKKPSEERQQSGSKGDSNKQEPPAGAHGKKESDSQGDQGGDKAGGGEEGAGQKAPRQGTGSSGQHDAADEGAGQSDEKGKGDNSPNAGKDAKSQNPTGTSGGEKGDGSKQQDGKGDKPGGKASSKEGPTGDVKNAPAPDAKSGDQKETKPAGKEAQPKTDQKSADKEKGRQGDKENAPKDASRNGASGGNGQPGMAVNPQPSITGQAPEGDAANLEYARKQTDLVLGKLSDQLNKKKVDDKLLKELGWTAEDLRRFVERWKQRKEAAQKDDQTGDAAKQELDDALRSLGLHKGELRQSTVKKDSMRDLKEGYRGPVPLEYQERLRAYNQGVSRAHRDDE